MFARESSKWRSLSNPAFRARSTSSRRTRSTPVCRSKVVIVLLLPFMKRCPVLRPVSQGLGSFGHSAVQKRPVGTAASSTSSSSAVSRFSQGSSSESARSFCSSRVCGSTSRSSGSASPLNRNFICRNSWCVSQVKLAQGAYTSQPCECRRTFSHVSCPLYLSEFMKGSAGTSVRISEVEKALWEVKKATCAGTPKVCAKYRLWKQIQPDSRSNCEATRVAAGSWHWSSRSTRSEIHCHRSS
mmetsp:Transcript_38941/g.97853  ORF Transcript_38941/g.97853 Transcript_38941/m.97853 type:complete len:242 (-) Transcript_38941:1240-1965(-)